MLELRNSTPKCAAVHVLKVPHAELIVGPPFTVLETLLANSIPHRVAECNQCDSGKSTIWVVGHFAKTAFKRTSFQSYWLPR
ncbi:hypothetical protein VTH82DRAFT_6828 [Thermothelomyces myriococcoides]